jgi:2-oxoglutarate dehydrogenase E1 component
MIDSRQTRESFYGPNAGYVLSLYEQYLADPDSVDFDTRSYFESLGTAPISCKFPDSAAFPSTSVVTHSIDAASALNGVVKGAAAARLARFIRQRGHLEADVDPLGVRPRHDAELALDEHGLTESDLQSLPSSVVGGPIAEVTTNALDAINRLRGVYSGSIGYDDEHIQNKAERYWLRNAAESGQFFKNMDAEWKQDVLERLTEVEGFEKFIDKTWPKEKRFSIEGTDMMVPMLDEIIHASAGQGIREVVLAMAHRGRLNVLAHVLGKPYEAIFSAFDDKSRPRASVAGSGNSGYTGDVKYHLGYHRDYKETGVAEMPISLVPNPSHLEFVNAVAVGHARAAQERLSQSGSPVRDPMASLAILIHGDAAFPGQGIVAETLNLSRLKGYSTDGAIHLIANNQVGFTTDPEDGRSTEYASDLAKGFEIPIVHVNADDPVACIAASRMACEYRDTFHKDFLIDLVGYRRYGHNEGDNPEFTQPVMYQIVEKHTRVREKWAATLAAEGVVSAEQAAALEQTIWDKLAAARTSPIKSATSPAESAQAARPRSGDSSEPLPATAQQLLELNAQLLMRPEGFQGDPKLERKVLQPRAGSISEPNGIAWGHAEALAYAMILSEGTSIRLTGQDCERGTFGHRNAVLHDMVTGKTFTPLQSISASHASFSVFNSPLSENAALGFEYGFNINAQKTLTLWEAQFGDFANGAQVIVDQFLASGLAKWQQASSLVMLLPHGYEGQGPEHSSARLERYLQLAANNNICVVNCTTAAQFFHVLRRQVASMAQDARPLIVMTPKSLLRHHRAASSLIDLTHGEFQTVVDDSDAVKRASKVTRLILCSGKIYMDMAYSNTYPYAPRTEFEAADQVALVRLEQLYPFPAEALQQVVGGYPNLREIVWMQEEPKNMGGWTFVEPRLRAMGGAGWDGPILYVGRPEAASPAEGSMVQHVAEQFRILKQALDHPAAVLVELPPAKQTENEKLEAESWGLGAQRRK